MREDDYLRSAMSAEQWAIVVEQLARGPHLPAPIPPRGGPRAARPLGGAAPYSRNPRTED